MSKYVTIAAMVVIGLLMGKALTHTPSMENRRTSDEDREEERREEERREEERRERRQKIREKLNTLQYNPNKIPLTTLGGKTRRI